MKFKKFWHLQKFSDLKIKRKIFVIFFTLFFFVFVVFFVNNYYVQTQELNEIVKIESNYLYKTFNNVKENEANILTSVLDVISHDQVYQDLYLRGEREELYNYSETLFKSLQAKYGITHWYFIKPDNTVFLRVHDRDFYGDQVKLNIFRAAREQKRPIYGLELGQSSFALRVVTPYYYNNELIGYLQLGKDIDTLLQPIQALGNNIFAILVNKAHIDKETFVEARTYNKQFNNWEDLSGHVILNDIDRRPGQEKCFNEDNIKELEDQEFLSKRVKFGNRIYECSGFVLRLPHNLNNGVVMYLLDVTPIASIAQNSLLVVSIFLSGMFIIVILAILMISRAISRPIIDLNKTINLIMAGGLTKPVQIDGHDEIGELAINFNILMDKLLYNRRYLDNVLEIMPSALFVLDSGGVMIAVNKAAAEVLGYTQVEMIGQKFKDFFARGNDEVLERFGMDNLVKIRSLDNQNVLFDTGKVKIPFAFSFRTLVDAQGQVLAIIFVIKDRRELIRYAQKRLNEVTPILKRVAQGDFSQEIIIHEQDEFTDHLITLNAMIRDFKSVMTALQAQSQELADKNEQLKKTTAEITKTKEGLEDLVRQRTLELQNKVFELAKFNKMAVNRELRMVSLKKEIKDLKRRLNII